MAAITTIERIGKGKANKLRKAGVRSCEALLETGGTKNGRKALAEATGFDEKSILEWVNRADLCRIKGVSSRYSDLLEAAGVDTVKELKRRNVPNLVAKMEEANSGRKKFVQRTPSVAVVQKWVDQAKELPVAVSP